MCRGHAVPRRGIGPIRVGAGIEEKRSEERLAGVRALMNYRILVAEQPPVVKATGVRGMTSTDPHWTISGPECPGVDPVA
jgi:hypothetical protein